MQCRTPSDAADKSVAISTLLNMSFQVEANSRGSIDLCLGKRSPRPSIIGSREVPSPEVQGRMFYQANHHRHLHERADYGRKGGSMMDCEDRHGHGDRQLEVVAGGGKRQRRGLGVFRPAIRPMMKLTRNMTTK